MDLKDFCFHWRVAVNDFTSDIVDWSNKQTYLNNDYKNIVRDDIKKVISIVKDSYRITKQVKTMGLSRSAKCARISGIRQ